MKRLFVLLLIFVSMGGFAQQVYDTTDYETVHSPFSGGLDIILKASSVPIISGDTATFININGDTIRTNIIIADTGTFITLNSDTIRIDVIYGDTATFVKVKADTIYVIERLGVGINSPEGELHVIGSAIVARFTYSGSETNIKKVPIDLLHLTDANMVDGFGTTIDFAVEDDASGRKVLGKVGAVRESADNEGAMVFLAGTDGNEEFMRIDHTGKMGIGTISPSYALEINGDLRVAKATSDRTLGTKKDLIIHTNDIGSYGGLAEIVFTGGSSIYPMASITTNYTNYHASGLGGDLIFGTKAGADANMSERMRITYGGDIGIGVTDPDTKLEVNGNIKQTVHTNDVSNPPTDAELDAIFGTAAVVGAGFTVLIDDNGGNAHFYMVSSNGTNWWTFTGTKAP